MSSGFLLHLANHSGGVLYVMAAMLFVALTVIVERSWYLQRASRAVHAAIADLDGAPNPGAAALNAFAQRYDGTPAASLFSAAARLAGQPERERASLDACLEEALMREAPRIDRSLWLLDTIVTLAPLLGLFGTIVGMFGAFQVLANPGNAPTQVTGGVAEALVATASGLFVAMVGLVFFNGLHTRVRSVVHQLDIMKTALANRLSGAPAGRETPRVVNGTVLSQQGA